MLSRNSSCLLALLLVALMERSVRSQAGVLNFDSTNGRVVENEGPAIIRIVRTGGSAGTLTASYMTTSITAFPTIDFITKSGNLTFIDGQTKASVQVPIINDEVEEPKETFFITMTGDVGPNALQIVEIVDDDLYTHWNRWSGQCSVTCGEGVVIQIRTRTCEAADQNDCELPRSETRNVKCNRGNCNVICWTNWSQWTPLGSCNLRCQQKWRRKRKCLCTSCSGPDEDQRKTRCNTSWCSLFKGLIQSSIGFLLTNLEIFD